MFVGVFGCKHCNFVTFLCLIVISAIRCLDVDGSAVVSGLVSPAGASRMNLQ